MLISTLLVVSSLAVPSKVVKVVVFPDRAQVTREAKVSCGQGVKLVLEDLPPSADAASFRAYTDRGTVDGLRVESLARVDAYAARVRELDAKIEAQRDQLRELADAGMREAAAAELADGYAAAARTLINRELLDGAANAKSWQSAVDHQVDVRLKVIAERAKIFEKERALRKALDELVRQRGFLGAAGQERRYSVDVLVSCERGHDANLQLTYMVGGAGWTPAYEARAADDDAAVDLTTYATVLQSTGEAWAEARIILSTALPRQNATPPEIAPLNVYSQTRPPPRKVIVSREQYHAHAEALDQTISLPVAGKQGNESAGRMAIRDQGLSVQLEVPEAATVAGDGTPARLQINKTTLRSQLKLRTAPRLLPYVFRVAETSNSAPFPLLPGAIDVFRRGSFLARYQLERVAVGARFTLTFGIEERVKVRRHTVIELQRDQGVLGPTRRRKFHYQLEVASYLPREEQLGIVEQVPVSELDDVKVGLDGTTSGYDHDKSDGMVRWRPRLKSGEKQKYDLKFYIDVPASYDAGGS